jgi:hypothetical protein
MKFNEDSLLLNYIKSVQSMKCCYIFRWVMINVISCEIKFRIAMAKAAFSKKRALLTSTFDLELRKKLVKCYI